MQIAHYLREVNFTTPLEEWINFDENGNPPASYDIINWHVTAEWTIEFVTVGHFVSSQGSHGQFHIDMDRVMWGGGSRHEVCALLLHFFVFVSIPFSECVPLNSQ